MIFQIITRTPFWVWALLALLIWLGYQQTKSQSMGLHRVIIIPVILTGLSIYSALSAFGMSIEVIFTWLTAATLSVFFVMQQPLTAWNTFNSRTRTLEVMGSCVPLTLMIGIFITKYVVSATLNLHPEFAQNTTFALAFSALYGIFSGVFIGRAARLWLLTRRAVVKLW
jgi:hypothetical protein